MCIGNTSFKDTEHPASICCVDLSTADDSGLKKRS